MERFSLNLAKRSCLAILAFTFLYFVIGISAKIFIPQSALAQAIFVPDIFTDFSDTPSSYSGEGGKCVKVKGAEDGVEFGNCSSGGGTDVALDLADDDSNESTAISEIATTGDTNSIFTEPAADKLLIDASQNWPTADTANAGDSATSFFSSGLIEHERGGLEADISAFNGLLRISGGSTSNITNLAGLNTALGTSIADGPHTTDTQADEVCAGDTTYLDGEGNCDDISSVYEPLGLTDNGVDFADIKYDNTLAANIALLVDECFFIATTSGGGFICEGSTADTSEMLFLFPDINEADTTHTITTISATQTLTNKTIDGDDNTVQDLDYDDIKSADRTGSDTDIVTGTAGTSGNCAEWNADGDLVDSGGTCGGGAGGAFSDAADPVVLNTTTKDVQIGDTGIGLSGKVEIGGDADQPQLVVQGHSTQTDDAIILMNNAGTEVFQINIDGTVNTRSIDSASMADDDHGDVNWSSGTAQVQEVQTGAISQANDVDDDLLTFVQMADADQRGDWSKTIETPVDADDLYIYRHEAAVTYTSLHCIVEDATSAVVVIVECDSAGDNCGTSRMSESITCDTNGQDDDGTIGNAAVAAGATIRAQVGTVTGTPGHVMISGDFTYDD